MRLADTDDNIQPLCVKLEKYEERYYEGSSAVRLPKNNEKE